MRAERYTLGFVDAVSTLTDALVSRTVERFWSLGGETHELGSGLLARSFEAPGLYLANFLFKVRTETVSEFRKLLSRSEAMTGVRCGRVIIDAETPAAVEAQLVLDDWQLDQQLQLVLPSTESVSPSGIQMCRVTNTDADWKHIWNLFRLDHLEEDKRARRSPRPSRDTWSAIHLRRSLGPSVEYYVHEFGGSPSACIAVWVSDERVGMIEDVFVHPDRRGQQVATGMLRYAVHRARERGADTVVIGAEADDTPKHLYADFGFYPASVTRSYLRPV